jgi:phytoene dehydrogenase-like protein
VSADVVIVGAGLSGLIAALYLQRGNLRPTLVERRPTVGGLCGTFEMDGYEFVIACNDFGWGLVDILAELGVPVQFESKKTHVHYAGKRVVLPPGLHTVPALLSDSADWLRLAWGIARRERPGARDLGTLIDSILRPSRVADLAKLPAYFMGVPPSDLPTEFFGFDKEFKYSYTKPACPVGGPGVLAETLARCVRERGGTILLEEEVRAVKRGSSGYLVRTARRELTSRLVIDTSERGASYPPDCKRGLPISMLCVAVDDSLRFPEGVHTIVHYPPAVADWFSALDRGEQPDEYGFHLFCSHLPRRGPHYTFNVYFYLPRGLERVDEAQETAIRSYLVDRIEPLLPGFRRALKYARLVDPRGFVERHSLSSRVMPYVLPPGTEKPPNVDPVTGIFHAGHTVHPPGEHAGAAVLSGRLTAERVIAALAPSAARAALKDEPRGELSA